MTSSHTDQIVGFHDGAPGDGNAPDLLTITCPRCGAEVTQRFYGPCAGCVGSLRVEQRRTGTATVDSEYVPKVNVTPNQVATKD